MSGGSWDYLYQRLEDAGQRLAESDDPHRIALGLVVDRLAKAMHDIEWVDSCDYAEGDEIPAILEAIGGPAPLLASAAEQLQDMIETAQSLLTEYRNAPNQPPSPRPGRPA